MLNNQKNKGQINCYNFFLQHYKDNFLKSIMFSKKAPRKLKNFIFEKEFLRKGISINRYRCFVTNNPRNVYSKLGLARIPIKTYGFAGRINGFFKSSW